MAAPRSHAELFRSLAALVPEKSEAVAHALRFPPARLPSVAAGQNERAAVILRWAERQPEGLAALGRALDDARGIVATVKKTGALGRIWSLPMRFIGAARGRSFRKRYLHHVGAERGILGAPGLGRGGVAAARFDDLFVEPQLLAAFQNAMASEPLHPSPMPATTPGPATPPTAPGATATGTARAPATRAPATLEECLGDLPAGMPLAITGRPGAGKSTLLARLALDAARGRLSSSALPRARIPLFLNLSEHVERIAGGTVSLATLAHGHYGDTARFPSLRPPAGWFERQLERGRCLVLLDGYDEIAAPADRARAVAWVGRQVARHPACRFVVASVADAGRAVPFAGARIVELLGWDASQVRRYVGAWYRATTAGAAHANVTSKTKSKSKKADPLPLEASFAEHDLLQRYDASPRLQTLAQNPLQLALLVMLHRNNGLAPDERVELYASACDALLDWRVSSDGDSLQPEQKRAVLQALARTMMERRKSDLTASEATEILGPAMIAAGVRGMAPRALLEQLSRGTGLLVSFGPLGPSVPGGAPGGPGVHVGPAMAAGPSRWRFAHLIFQEYLCAADWERHAEPRLPGGWQSLAGDAWWHETLRLHAASRDAAAIVSACLDVRTVSSLLLATLCAGEVVSLPALLRRSVFEVLDAELASPDPALRRLAAETRFSRRLRSLYRTGASHEIDLEELTGAEYQLFLSDVGGAAFRYAPDHWMSASLPPRRADSPLLGVRTGDALAFCAWLSNRSPGVLYRLPTPVEMFEYPGGRPDVLAWCAADSANGSSDGAAPLLSLPESIADASLGALELAARDDLLPPPAVDVLVRELPRDVAATHAAMHRPLASLPPACARAVDERAAESDGVGDGPTVAIRELRRAAPPEEKTRTAVLDYLALVHRALGTDHDELPPAHYQAQRRNVYLDYHLILDVVLATVLACELPLFVESAVQRTAFEADPALTIGILRALGFYGQEARYFVEKKLYAEAARALTHQLTRGVPAQDRAMYRLAVLASARLAILAAPSPESTLRAFWRYGARLAALAHEFANRASAHPGGQSTGESRAGSRLRDGALLGDSAGRRYREWADGPLLDLYWWIQLTLARADDRVIAWEGIRIVRETPPAALPDKTR